jgi:hypothetical protein
MLAGVASSQPQTSESGLAKAGAIMEGRATSRSSSNHASPGQTFSHESRAFVQPLPAYTSTRRARLGNTLFTGDYGCRFVIPAGATSLEIQMSTTTPNADVDLYVRAGNDIDLSNGHAVADFSSSGPPVTSRS